MSQEKNSRRAVSERVVDAIAAAEGVGAVELTEPLNDSVDPDALNSVFAPRHDGSARTGNGSVEFSSNGYCVVVEKNGDVRLDPQAERPV